MKKITWCILLFLLIGLHAGAQSYEVPKDYHFKTQDDYSRYEPDVVKTADWVIDLGPEGGSGGGMIIAEGTPEQVVKVKASYTGHFLKPLLK
ncbi:MAG: hypothetical protein EOP54_26550 [Sphingobacteriales bacterium]|nr:MAG: hypothetical protein EOP54_26550 [Sphingobacteriales bacterium]